MSQKNGFDKLASVYQILEYITMAKDLERSRFQYLEKAQDAQRILILGEGDGRFLQRLLKINSYATIDCVDASGGMLSQAKKRILSENPKEEQRVRFHQALAQEWVFPQKEYDLVVTLFFLDCFSGSNLEYVIGQIHGSLKDKALWLWADFHIPAQGFWRWRAWLLIQTLYLIFFIFTGLKTQRLEDFPQYLEAVGMKREEGVSFQGGLLVSELWSWEE